MTEGRNLEQPKPATDEMIKQAIRDELYRRIKDHSHQYQVIDSLTASYCSIIRVTEKR